MRRTLILALAVLSLGALSSTAQAQIRLIGITGNQEFVETSDEKLFEINLANASTTSLFTTTHIPDTDAIGYNPADGLIYHFSGSETYSNNPGSNGYRDHQYLETINLATQQVVPIFNANPPPSPDSVNAFGLPAPRPDWLLPVDIRLETQIEDEFRARGPDEYHAVREAAWSSLERLFYIADEHGIFKVTPEGDSTFVGQPATEPEQMKGIEFVNVGGQTKLLAGSRESAFLYELDPATGQEIGAPLEIMAPPLIPTDPLQPTTKILALAQHPVTGVLYAISQPDGGDPLTDRHLVTIDLTTGNAAFVGKLTTPIAGEAAFASLAFVGFTTPPGDFDGDRDTDGTDFLTWQRNFGGVLDGDDFLEWRRGFGEFGAAAAVPEPATLVAAMLALICLGGARSRVTKPLNRER